MLLGAKTEVILHLKLSKLLADVTDSIIVRVRVILSEGISTSVHLLLLEEDLSNTLHEGSELQLLRLSSA